MIREVLTTTAIDTGEVKAVVTKTYSSLLEYYERILTNKQGALDVKEAQFAQLRKELIGDEVELDACRVIIEDLKARIKGRPNDPQGR